MPFVKNTDQSIQYELNQIPGHFDTHVKEISQQKYANFFHANRKKSVST